MEYEEEEVWIKDIVLYDMGDGRLYNKFYNNHGDEIYLPWDKDMSIIKFLWNLGK